MKRPSLYRLFGPGGHKRVTLPGGWEYHSYRLSWLQIVAGWFSYPTSRHDRPPANAWTPQPPVHPGCAPVSFPYAVEPLPSLRSRIAARLKTLFKKRSRR